MTPLISWKEQPVLKPAAGYPALLITMPFEPKLFGRILLEQQVKLVQRTAEQLLMSQYSVTDIKPVIEKLHMSFRGLNYDSFKKSIAIFISSLFNRVLYLDASLEEEVLLNS